MANKRILSIQSHVVSGYVGNKAAVFPLQLIGFDVDVINSVHFSNHTGYPNGVKGDIRKGEQLRDILIGMEQNDLLQDIGHLLTGYIGSESFLEAVCDVIQRLRAFNPVRYVCDPVLGDNGMFYVPKSLVQVYIDKLVPLADILTPNQFEVEQLTGIAIKSMDDAMRACSHLHDMGPQLVFVTSMVLEHDDTSRDENNGETMSILASERFHNDSKSTQAWRIEFPLLPGQYTGTGDLTAALLLAHTALMPNNTAGALERVLNTMFEIIEKTSASCGDTVQSRELKLVQSKSIIENPQDRFKSIRIL